ncbi:MAG TPA: tRNA (adenosine(37)-N6)-threonylcarbamoyltransferase complex ATPase subunit type 1 TsaE [Ktedonobacterales bacterium]
MAARPDRPAASAVALSSESAACTYRLGKLLGGLLRPGDVVLLEGPLGAGKTALTQGIGAGLEIPETINSPTFTLLKEYVGRLPLYHFDLYRIEDPEELFALGFEDYFGGEGVCVVEWADRGVAADGATPWPASWLRIVITPDGVTKRTLTSSATGERGEALLRAFVAAAEGGR